MRSLIHILVFQVAWFGTVLGAAHNMPWLSLLFVPPALVLHLVFTPAWMEELLLAIGATLAGLVFDTALIWAGVYSPVPFLFHPPLSPLWMVLLWVNLATILTTSLRFLQGRYWLSAMMGAVGGPMAYYSGARIGAMTGTFGAIDLIVLAMAWATALPFLVFLSDAITRRLRP
jgi:hypothetical protein